MNNGQGPPQQTGCSLPNLLLPFFLIGGPVLGWSLARPFGWWWGLLGSGAGLVLVVPAIGLTIAAVVGIVMATERLTGRRAEPDTGPESADPTAPSESESPRLPSRRHRREGEE